MGYTDKHFRLSEDICTLIEEREKGKFPLERDFVAEAIRSYDNRVSLEKIYVEIHALRESMEHLYQSVGWK